MPRLEQYPSYEQVNEDMAVLARNKYPGRLIVMGLSSDGARLIQGYALMGRSASSRNRLFLKEESEEGTKVRVVAPDKGDAEMAATEDAELIYYDAMQERPGLFTVSNGAQTGPVTASLEHGYRNISLLGAVKAAPTITASEKFDGAVDLSSFEPDKPNNTPRITGVIDLREGAITEFGLAIARKNSQTGKTIRNMWRLNLADLTPGVGYGLHTYADNAPEGVALPSFDRSPFFHPLAENNRYNITAFWNSYMDAENRVAMVFRSIGLVAQKRGAEAVGSVEYSTISQRAA